MPVSHNTRAALVALAVLAVLVGLGLGIGARQAAKTEPAPTTTPAPSASVSAAPSWSPSTPPAPAGVRLAWAYVESIDGGVRTGGDNELRELDDLVVPALAQDYLDRGEVTTDQTPAPDVSGQLRAALTGSADDITWLEGQNGGRDEAMGRVIDACSLKSTKLNPVRMTALETARLGACLRESAIAQPDAAKWVLEEMRENTGGIGDVRGSDAAQQVAQQNSVVLDGDRYRAGCLAVGAFWSAAVLVDYPADRGEGYAATVCATTARAAFPPDMQQVPETISPAPADPAVRA
jgi:hypothetical protein